MEYIPREASVRLLKKYLPEIGLSVPLSESDLDEASDFFDAMEFSLAVDKNEGREYDQELLDAVCRAYDDFTPIEDDDYIDMDALNARLQSAEPWSPPLAQEKAKKPCKRNSSRADRRTRGDYPESSLPFRNFCSRPAAPARGRRSHRAAGRILINTAVVLAVS